MSSYRLTEVKVFRSFSSLLYAFLFDFLFMMTFLVICNDASGWNRYLFGSILLKLLGFQSKSCSHQDPSKAHALRITKASLLWNFRSCEHGFSSISLLLSLSLSVDYLISKIGHNTTQHNNFAIHILTHPFLPLFFSIPLSPIASFMRFISSFVNGCECTMPPWLLLSPQHILHEYSWN